LPAGHGAAAGSVTLCTVAPFWFGILV
jgi:hypothetical protein